MEIWNPHLHVIATDPAALELSNGPFAEYQEGLKKIKKPSCATKLRDQLTSN